MYVIDNFYESRKKGFVFVNYSAISDFLTLRKIYYWMSWSKKKEYF